MNRSNMVKRNIRLFTRQMAAEQGSWPYELYHLGRFAADALRTLDQRNPCALLVREAAKDVTAFYERYAAFIAASHLPRQH